MMNSKELLAQYGLKWNPFLPDIPAEALWFPPVMDSFIFRLENLVMDGGFALICGEPGLGKSKSLHILASRLERLDDVIVVVMERPQSSLNDFYREMGELFDVNLVPSNRYGGFKALRERWKAHIKSTLFRPVLIIEKKEEIQIAFNLWEIIGQLDALLWDRYFEEFNEIICALEDEEEK